MDFSSDGIKIAAQGALSDIPFGKGAMAERAIMIAMIGTGTLGANWTALSSITRTQPTDCFFSDGWWGLGKTYHHRQRRAGIITRMLSPTTSRRHALPCPTALSAIGPIGLR